MEWIDNADSYKCPVCKTEVNSPVKYDYRCPVCGFMSDRDKIKYKHVTNYNTMTNADRIRAMNDEELADFLLKMMSDVQCFAKGIFSYHPGPQNHNCKQCGIDWLQQPAEENNYE